jgi:hypothetical protein
VNVTFPRLTFGTAFRFGSSRKVLTGDKLMTLVKVGLTGEGALTMVKVMLIMLAPVVLAWTTSVSKRVSFPMILPGVLKSGPVETVV